MMKKQKIKVLLAGSPKLAIPAFQALLDDQRFEILGLLTQPDQPAGRGLKLTPPSAKVWALENDLTVWQPEKIKLWQNELIDLKPDVVVVIAYGKLIPEAMLNQIEFGWVNIHGSLLPKYRGAGVLFAPIINNDKETGVSIMKLVKEMDAGPIITQEKIILDNQETMGSLSEKIATVAAEILPNTLFDYIQGKLVPQEQDQTRVSYAGLISTEDAKIDWQKEAVDIDALVRAMQPAPGAWTMWREQRIKIIAGRISEQGWLNPGKVGLLDGQLAIGSKKGSLIIDKIQLAGRPVVSAQEFLIGQPQILGEYLT